MAYDEKLAKRVRTVLRPEDGYVEKKMFGGICYLLNGNMVCGILNDELIVRVGADSFEKSLILPYARKFDITGRPMTGWVVISSEGIIKTKALKQWINKGIAFARTLPPK